MSLLPTAVSLLVKPAGPDCNLRCTYCFYRQKAGMFPGSKQHRMKPSTLELLVSQAMNAGRELVMFSWQGGEPALMGLDFYRRVVELQQQYMKPGQIITNALQTNATLIDRKWAQFLRDYNFLVGVSLDGPEDLHDCYRHDTERRGTHAVVMRNLRTMLEVGVEVNILTLLNDRNVREPDRVHDFLINTGVKHFQFVPCVEPGPGGQPAHYSISPSDYGKFLCRIFDRWMDSPMDIHIRDFDDLMALYNEKPANTCIYQRRCGGYLVVEHTGDVFPCDFFVLPKWRIGSLQEATVAELLNSEKLAEFGDQKEMLSPQCEACSYLAICRGGCVKHRVVLGAPPSAPTYFCSAYRQLFDYSVSVLKEIAGVSD